MATTRNNRTRTLRNPSQVKTVCKIQRNGVITIPARIRLLAGLRPGDFVRVAFHRGKIIITPIPDAEARQ